MTTYHWLEGYASLFGEPDLIGDVVHKGAFAKSIANGDPVPLLLEHNSALRAGVWTVLEEDRIGLFVRGRLEQRAPASSLARRRLAAGVDGLSIGFRTHASRARASGGRDLLRLDLIEVSLVQTPMAPRARLSRSENVLASMEKSL